MPGPEERRLRVIGHAAQHYPATTKLRVADPVVATYGMASRKPATRQATSTGSPGVRPGERPES